MNLSSGVGNTSPTDLCYPGYYCPGGQDNPTPPEYLCWPGHYCESGSVIPIPCVNGTYQNSSGQSVCVDCPASYFCDPAAGENSF